MTVVQVLDSILSQTRESAKRAALLAAKMAAQGSVAAFAACLLKEAEGFSLAVVDVAGRTIPEAEEYLRERALAPGGSEALAEWEHFPLPGVRVLDAAISFAEQNRGLLAVGLPEADEADSLRQILEEWAGCLGLRLAFEEEHIERQRLENNTLDERFLADIAQVSRPVVHELFNLLNTLTLQVEVLKLRFPADAAQADLAILKKQVTAMVEVLKAFRNYRKNQVGGARPIDFNRLIRDTVASLQRDGLSKRAVDLGLAPTPVHLKGSEGDAERLLRFLLINADASDVIRVSTTVLENKLVLTVDGFLDNPAAELHQALEANRHSKELCGALELAAFKMLLESFRGRIRTEPSPVKGLRALIELATVATT